MPLAGISERLRYLNMLDKDWSGYEWVIDTEGELDPGTALVVTYIDHERGIVHLEEDPGDFEEDAED